MKALLFLCLSFLAPLLIIAQNLIPNGSFERTKGKADHIISTSRENFNQKAKFWYSPTNASPDLYRLAPDNDQYPPNFKLITPPTGRNMAGLILSTPEMGIGCTFYKEYLQVKLKDTLRIGTTYLLEFWVSPVNSGIREIGLLLSEEAIYTDRCEVLEVQPQFVFKDSLHQRTWKKISYQFKPSALYTYLTVGSFETEGYKKSAYCYLDDFKLTPVETQQNIEEKISIKNQAPNSQPISQLLTEETFNPSTIQFEHGKATLTTAAYTELDKLITYLTQKQNLQILIEGHTDNSGTIAENQLLSINRANAVKTYLTSKGIATRRMIITGYGETQPIESNEKEVGRARNRRVVFKVQKSTNN